MKEMNSPFGQKTKEHIIYFTNLLDLLCKLLTADWTAPRPPEFLQNKGNVLFINCSQ